MKLSLSFFKNQISSMILPYKFKLLYKVNNTFKILISCLFLSVFLSSPAFSAGSKSSSDDKPDKPTYSRDYYKAIKLIRTKSFDEALIILENIVQRKPNDANIHNYMGFSFRKKGMLEKSAYHYERALDIDPKHLGALEYQGELYILLGDIEKAKENLNKIDDICWNECTEMKELKEAIQAAK